MQYLAQIPYAPRHTSVRHVIAAHLLLHGSRADRAQVLRSAKQSPLTGFDPKGFRTAGSNTANTVEETCALQLLKETIQPLLQPVKLGKRRHQSRFAAFFRRIGKKVATVRSSITLREKISHHHLIQPDDTLCEEICCTTVPK